MTTQSIAMMTQPIAWQAQARYIVRNATRFPVAAVEFQLTTLLFIHHAKGPGHPMPPNATSQGVPIFTGDVGFGLVAYALFWGSLRVVLHIFGPFRAIRFVSERR